MFLNNYFDYLNKENNLKYLILICIGAKIQELIIIKIILNLTYNASITLADRHKSIDFINLISKIKRMEKGFERIITNRTMYTGIQDDNR